MKKEYLFFLMPGALLLTFIILIFSQYLKLPIPLAFIIKNKILMALLSATLISFVIMLCKKIFFSTESKAILNIANKNIKNQILNLKKTKIIVANKKIQIKNLPFFAVINDTSSIRNVGLPINYSMENDLFNCFVIEKTIFLELAAETSSLSIPTMPAKADSWSAILAGLKKYKTLNAIDGLVLNFDIIELYKKNGESRQRYIKVMVDQLKNIKKFFSLNFPIYVNISNCQQIFGFLDFFNNFKNKQVLGFTLPFKKIKSQNWHKILQTEYEKFLFELNDQTLSMFAIETNPDIREKAFFFPQHLQLYKELMISTLTEIFQSDELGGAIKLRGVYFTAPATFKPYVQQNFLGHLTAREFNITQNDLVEYTVNNDEFFLKNLYVKIMASDGKIIRSFRRFNNIKTWSICLIVLSLLIIHIIFLFKKNKEHELNFIKIQNYLLEYNTIKNSNAQKSLPEILAILNPLKSALDLSYNYKPRYFLGLKSLKQEQKMQSIILDKLIYALNTQFMPKIINRLEYFLAKYKNDQDAFYTIFKGYMALSNPKTYPKEWLLTAINYELEDLNVKEKDDLILYLNLLFKYSSNPITLNQNVINQVSEQILTNFSAENIYAQIKRLASYDSVSSFNLTDLANKDKKICHINDKNISEFFTKHGFTKYYSKHLLTTVNAISDDFAILGNNNKQFAATMPDIDELIKSVHELYFKDYIYYWEQALVNLDLIEFTNLDEIVVFINTLSQNNTALKNVMTIINENSPQLLSIFEQHKNLQYITTEFNGKLSLEEFYQTLKTFYPYLHKISEDKTHYASLLACKSIIKQEKNTIADVFEVIDNPQMSPLIKKWNMHLINNIKSLMLYNSKQYLEHAWHEQIFIPYTEIKQYYPFTKETGADLDMQKFIDFFGSHGAINKFYTTYLQEFLSLASTNWHWKENFNTNTAETNLKLQKLKELLHISALFFPNNTNEFALNLMISPLKLSADCANMTLKIGENSIVYSHGPQEKHLVKWSTTAAMLGVMLNFNDFQGNAYTKIYEGQWALFRFIDKGKLFKYRDGAYMFNVKSETFNASFVINMPDADKIFSVLQQLDISENLM